MRAGRTLGRYQLIAPLGAGGMAEVWQARTVGPGGFERRVVIKCIRAAYRCDAEFEHLFLDEAKILGLLHHVNVVQVLDFADEDGALFLALEYVDGPSLSRVLRMLHRTGRRMPPAIAAYVAREICRALDYVHNLKDGDGDPLAIVHRDVTPSNIVFTSSGGLKLLDFGVAKFKRSEPMTRAGTVRGKPAYLAPEQIEGEAIDGRADLFALGIVLHELLSLQHLFAGDSDLITVRKVLEMKIPTPSSRTPDVPAALDAIVMKALERDRDRRYGSAAEMARALDDFVIASRLHVDEVADFLRSLEAEAAPAATTLGTTTAPTSSAASEIADGTPPTEDSAPTVKEIGLPSHLRGPRRHRARPTRGVAATVAGAALVAALATVFGLRGNLGAGKIVARVVEPAAAISSRAATARR